jgi:sporulation protein YlmC with PRC-barrel domain
MFSKPRFLASAQVRGLGADALTIEGEETLTEAAPASAEELAAKPLEGRPVLNQAGTILGKIADVAVDTEALRVPYLLLATSLLDNALHGKPQLPLSQVQTIGADSVIVSNAYDPKSPVANT